MFQHVVTCWFTYLDQYACGIVSSTAQVSAYLYFKMTQRIDQSDELEDSEDIKLGYKSYFYKRSNHEESFRTVKINHKNSVK